MDHFLRRGNRQLKILNIFCNHTLECICKHTKNKIWYVSGPMGKKSWYVSHHQNECLEVCICKHTIYFLNAFKFIHCDVCTMLHLHVQNSNIPQSRSQRQVSRKVGGDLRQGSGTPKSLWKPYALCRMC